MTKSFQKPFIFRFNSVTGSSGNRDDPVISEMEEAPVARATTRAELLTV